MGHQNFESLGWSLHWTGFFVGLVTWIVFSGLFVWAITAIYKTIACVAATDRGAIH